MSDQNPYSSDEDEVEPMPLEFLKSDPQSKDIEKRGIVSGKKLKETTQEQHHSLKLPKDEERDAADEDEDAEDDNTSTTTCIKLSSGSVTHNTSCDPKIFTPIYEFPGGVFKPQQSMIDRLLNEGISVPKDLRCFPHRATFQLNCYFQDIPKKPKDTDSRSEYKHIPLSVSVSSNVPGYDEPRPKCIISKGDTQQLVDEMIENLKKISLASYKIMKTKFNEVFVKLDEQLNSISTQDNQDNSDLKCKLKKHLNALKSDFDGYLKELPVLGFNSSKYDINVMTKQLFTSLAKSDCIYKFISKRKGLYLAIKTEHFKFLDISNYLAAGCSSSEFLKAYDCEEVKGFFPFGWMDSLEKLNQETLPPETEFTIELNGTCLSSEDYKTCTDAWKNNNTHTMREYLEWYTNRNVVHFLHAVEKMSQFYKDKNIDMFKDGISAPGLSLYFLFEGMNDGDFFTLVEKQHRDFYHTLKDSIVGGPSIVFHRHHEKDETRIRGGKECKKVIGYDANALYLSCLMQEMPVGPFIRRKAEDNFRPCSSHSHISMAIDWLEWESSTQAIKIQHKGNAREKRIGPTHIPYVDGYCKETNTVYQLHICYWTGHRCDLNNKDYNDSCKTSMLDLRKKYDNLAKEIRAMKYTLVEKRECEWKEEKKNNCQLKEFLKPRRLPLQEKWSMQEKDIIQAIRDGELFGFVECDITVPKSKTEKFSEMTPIFKNIDIAFDKGVIGDHMYEYAETNKLLSKQPRRNLVGSMSGEKILLATPLLKWYLENGLEITKIYQVVQYRASRCFEKFGEDISDARREGDRGGSKARADTMKLIGNSAYGKTVTNKGKFNDVEVCLTDADANRLIKKPRFRNTTDIGQGAHEVELSKRSIKVDLPLQIGLFVYQYAKLKMLQFYYEFLDRFIDRSDFQLCQMDTDSAYIAIAGNDLKSVIKADMREEYERDKHKWFPRCDTPEHERYDKRTPGLFKVEYEGDGIVALCSKTYICFGEEDKVRCIGLNKDNLNKEMFFSVLKNRCVASGVYRGYKRTEEGMVTYSQKKRLPYLYIKRKVGDDGVTTTYL